jgi:hypothetical protein
MNARHNPPLSPALIKAVAVAFELTGQVLSDAAAHAFVRQMSQFDERQVISALERCTQELSRRITPADVIERIDDGRPGPAEAFSMLPRGEVNTYLLTDEMEAGWRACASLIADRSQQHQAFRTFEEIYKPEVIKARLHGRPVRWKVTQGTDRAIRESVIAEAVADGRLSVDYAAKIIPVDRAIALMAPEQLAALPAPPEESAPVDPRVRAITARLVLQLTGKAPKPRAGGGGQSDPDAGG